MINFVTSFSADGYEQYAKKMLLSVDTFWGADVHLTAFYHDFNADLIADLPVSKRITYRNLNEVQDMLDFRESFQGHDGTEGGKAPYNWRIDGIKFCHKVFALTEFAFELAEESKDAGWMIWLDADTVTTTKFNAASLGFMDDQSELVYLGRPHVEYSETSFLAFNLNRQPPLDLLGDLRGAYISGEVFTYREWHDGFVFERLLRIYNAHGLRSNDLTGHLEIKNLAEGKQAFELSPLGDYMEHFKGGRKDKLSNKEVSPDVTGPKRYRQLADLVRLYSTGKETYSIVETGTWNGGRAIEMALAAFENVDKVCYTGYDLFEDATDELDKSELNSKAHNTLSAVQYRLHQFKEVMAKRENKEFIYDLRKGDTKETLTPNPCEMDFVYIDGGHSDDTVQHDFKCLSMSPIVVFDDYFSKDEHGNEQPDEFLGVNRIFESFEGEKTLFPSSDRVIGGGFTHLALFIVNESLPKPPDSMFKQPIIVRPVDSAPKEHIQDSVRVNLKNINKWLEQGSVHTGTAIIVSAGPSTDYEELAQVMDDNPDHELVCVKHSYPKLMEKGFVPDSCVILDPREIDGMSTHGIIRRELFPKIKNKHTQFLVASMTDPSVTEFLMNERKFNVLGWHAYSQALQESINDVNSGKVKLDESLNIPQGTTLITGGTCAAMRSFGLYHTLGFRDFHLFGFDSSFNRAPTAKQKKETVETKPKYLQVSVGDKKFWTTGELLAMAQDCEKLFERQDVDMNIHFHGKRTLVRALWDIRPDTGLRYYKEFMK